LETEIARLQGENATLKKELLARRLRAIPLDCAGTPGEGWIPVPLAPPTASPQIFSGSI
jgi:hypothetical protein